MKTKQIGCVHVKKARRFYAYSLIGSTLYLCKKCERKLRKKMFEQAKIEKEMPKYFKRVLNKRKNLKKGKNEK